MLSGAWSSCSLIYIAAAFQCVCIYPDSPVVLFTGEENKTRSLVLDMLTSRRLLNPQGDAGSTVDIEVYNSGERAEPEIPARGRHGNRYFPSCS